MNDKVAVFGQRRAGVYLLSEIYNPDNVRSSVQNVGKVIPAVGSLVIDDSVEEHNTLYVVYSVDAVTFRTTLVPAKITAGSDIGDNQIITYGNNVYMLYYNKVNTDVYDLTDDSVFVAGKNYYTRTGTSPNYEYVVAEVEVGAAIASDTYYEKTTKVLWEINPDSKISIVGSRAATYTIYKGSSLTPNTSMEVVSNFYYENGELIESNRIPMDGYFIPQMVDALEATVVQAKVARPCYSDVAIEDDSTYTMAVYDGTGMLIAQITLIGHPVLALSALAAVQYPISSFYVNANQYIPAENKAYLLRGQNIDELIFYPHVTFSNGDSLADAAIDNTQLFIYGKEEISTAVPGAEFTVLFKYFLGNNETTSVDRDYKIGASGRYITTTVTVKILDSVSSAISKIAPIIQYDPTNKYEILPLVYYVNREEPSILTDDWQYSSFDGSVYNFPQVLKIRTTEQIPGEADTSYYVQTYQMSLFNPATAADGVNYYFRDEPSSTDNFYGKRYSNGPRPAIIKELTTTTSAVRYYIDPVAFETVDKFLANSYYRADPPTCGDMVPKRPTHFIIRQLDMTNKTANTVTTGPISIEDYQSDIGILAGIDLGGTEGQPPKTCIVEFLYTDESTSGYEYLYGVPVDVIVKSITPQTGTYKGDVYVVMNDTLYEFTYAGTNYDVNTDRTWSNTDGYSIAATEMNGGYVWAIYRDGTMLSDCVSDVFPLDQNYLDPTQVGWDESVQLVSRTSPPVIYVTSPVTINAKKGLQFIQPLTAQCSTGGVCTFSSNNLPIGVDLISGDINGTITTPGTFTCNVKVTSPGAVPSNIIVNIIVEDVSDYRGPMYIQVDGKPVVQLEHSGGMGAYDWNRSWNGVYNLTYQLYSTIDPSNNHRVWTIALSNGDTYKGAGNLNETPMLEPWDDVWPSEITYIAKDAPAAANYRGRYSVELDGVSYTLTHTGMSGGSSETNLNRVWTYSDANVSVTLSAGMVGTGVYSWKIEVFNSSTGTTTSYNSSDILTQFSNIDPDQVTWDSSVTAISKLD